MKEKKIFDAITEVDDVLIEEARVTKLKKQFRKWKKWIAIAASLVLVIGIGGFSLLRMGSFIPGGTSGSNGHSEGNVFMSYAGPVFPLTLSENTDGLSAKRKIDFDFSSYIPRKEEYETHDGKTKTYKRYDSEVIVTDSYMVKNSTNEELVASGIYPFAGTLHDDENIIPTITVNGLKSHAVLHPGSYTGSFEGVYGKDGPEENETLNLAAIKSWEGYEALLSNGEYLDRAFDEFPLFDQTVAVYEFSDIIANHENGENPTLNMEFIMDYSKTMIFTYGFNGGSMNSDKNYRACHFSIPEEFNSLYGMPRYLIVMGEDIDEYVLQGYMNGGCDEGNELEGVTATVNRYVITLGEALWNAMVQSNEFYNNDVKRTMNDTVSMEIQYGLAAELLLDYDILSDEPMDRYDIGMLEDIFSEVLTMDRVLYLSFDIAIPPGESVSVEASMVKEHSFDYDGSGSDNMDVDGYDMVTRLGSNMTFTEQTASIQDHDLIEIVRQNFGFNLEKGIREVILDLDKERYYMEIKSKLNENGK